MPTLSQNLRHRRAIIAKCQPQPPSVADELAACLQSTLGAIIGAEELEEIPAGSFPETKTRIRAALARYNAEKGSK
jgi:hypothetical protein